jgi:hypothetical protein
MPALIECAEFAGWAHSVAPLAFLFPESRNSVTQAGDLEARRSMSDWMQIREV